MVVDGLDKALINLEVVLLPFWWEHGVIADFVGGFVVVLCIFYIWFQPSVIESKPALLLLVDS